MRYKNPLTALVLAGVAGIGTSAYAVNLDAVNPGTAEYAEELNVPVLGLTLNGDLVNEALNVTTVIGFGITGGDNHSLRLDIAPAVFDGDPDIDLACQVGLGNLTSGGDGANFVIFDVTGDVGGCAQDAVVEFEIPAVEVGDQSDITVEFGNYATATGAANKVGGLYGNSGTLLTFTPAWSVAANLTVPDEIDVTTNSTEFTGGLLTQIGEIEAEIDTDVLWSDGQSTESADLLDAAEDQLLILSGDFSAAQDLTAGVPNGDFTNADGIVFADASGGCGDQDVVADLAASDGADAIFDVAGPTPAEFLWDICYEVNGVSEIADGPITGLYDIVAETGSDASDQDLGVVSVLQKNGSTASANFVLTPGGVFRNWIRVCNNSSIDGRVFARLTNDLGDTVAFDLSDVTGIAATLDANECTQQILVDDLFAAGQATDPSFDVGAPPRNKLRAEFEGEFDPIAIDNITVSRDNNTFNTFQ